MSRWQEVWARRERDEASSDVLQQLIYLDGFDAGAGHIAADRWREFVAAIAARLGVVAGDTLFEVGCGGGALLHPFFSAGHRVAGCDFATAQVAHAAEAMPGMTFQVAEAAALPLDEPYDHVLANAVFHYFPDLGYAEAVLGRMLTKATKAVAVLDVSDHATARESERARAGALGADEYARKYDGRAHLYYPRTWFHEMGARHGWAVETFGQVVHDYGNNPYRFNCVSEKAP